jgi:hypothetical protein
MLSSSMFPSRTSGFGQSARTSSLQTILVLLTGQPRHRLAHDPERRRIATRLPLTAPVLCGPGIEHEFAGKSFSARDPFIRVLSPATPLGGPRAQRGPPLFETHANQGPAARNCELPFVWRKEQEIGSVPCLLEDRTKFLSLALHGFRNQGKRPESVELPPAVPAENKATANFPRSWQLRSCCKPSTSATLHRQPLAISFRSV